MNAKLVEYEDLRVWTNGVDRVVAASVDDAWDVWCQSIGETMEDYFDEWTWTECTPWETLTIWNDIPTSQCDCLRTLERSQTQLEKAEKALARMPYHAAKILRPGLPKPPQTLPNGHLKSCPVGSEKKTCAQWAMDNGRGFLCSSEW